MIVGRGQPYPRGQPCHRQQPGSAGDGIVHAAGHPGMADVRAGQCGRGQRGDGQRQTQAEDDHGGQGVRRVGRGGWLVTRNRLLPAAVQGTWQ